MLERGAALVTALLVVALATMVTTSMMHALALDIRRGSNLDTHQRAWHYAAGLEAWAKVILRRDARESGSHDSRKEAWATPLPPLPIAEGQLRGRVQDLDGRFNLNNLIIEGRVNEGQVERLRRLLRALQLDSTLADAIVDWLDSDSIETQQGAEDLSYARARPPYRAANGPFYHPSELRLVAGIDGRVYRSLAPHIATLPAQEEPTEINLNTATVAVLMSLDDAITAKLAERLYADGRASHKSVSAFFQPSQLARIPWQSWAAQGIPVGLDSRHFLLHGVVEIDQSEQEFSSMIVQYRSNFQVSYRARGPY